YFSFMIRPPPSPTLFPYTTLFRSLARHSASPKHLATVSLLRAWTQQAISFAPRDPWALPRTAPRSRIIYPSLPLAALFWRFVERSEEHTSELQSQSNLVCRLLLEK